jgi:transketolase
VRRAFADTLHRMAAADDRVMLLTGDLGYGVFDKFVADFGPRYVNVGVAEAQLVDCAAGLALEGWRPLAYSIASFATGRCYEQIRVAVGYHDAPVVIVGAGGGYTYSDSGVTHHAADDLALMSAIPAMTVVAPGSPEEMTALLPQLLALDAPSYIRVGRYGEPDYPAAAPAQLGRARLVRAGAGVAVVTTGDVASEAASALDELARDGITPLHLQMHTVKPLDTAALDALPASVHTIIAVEEHFPQGGLAAALYAWKGACNAPARIERLGPPQALALGGLDRAELRRRFGFDAAAIAAACRRAWSAAR